MNEKPVPSRPHAVTVLASALATAITLGIFAGVTALFAALGLPMGNLAAAERACAGHAYVSDREACMRERIEVTATKRIAHR